MIALLLYIAADLRDELLDMAKADQEVRARVDWTNPDEADVKAVQTIDRQNAKRLSEIMGQHGWPNISLVGKDGAHAAWLIAQHATHDRKLMSAAWKRCASYRHRKSLRRIKHLSPIAWHWQSAASRSMAPSFGSRTARPFWSQIEDEASVDDRRKAIGLEPLAEYVARVRKQLAR